MSPRPAMGTATNVVVATPSVAHKGLSTEEARRQLQQAGIHELPSPAARGLDRASAMCIAWIIGGLLAVHGLLHLMRFAQAFGYTHLPQFTQPVSRPMGVAWMAAALLVLASAALLVARAQDFWVVGAVAVAVSQALIISAWRDAWAGTTAVYNVRR